MTFLSYFCLRRDFVTLFCSLSAYFLFFLLNRFGFSNDYTYMYRFIIVSSTAFTCHNIELELSTSIFGETELVTFFGQAYRSKYGDSIHKKYKSYVLRRSSFCYKLYYIQLSKNAKCPISHGNTRYAYTSLESLA